MIHHETFVRAAKDGNSEYVKTHIKNASMPEKIAAFVFSPHVEVLKLLLTAGVDINVMYKSFDDYVDWDAWEYLIIRTALYDACAWGHLNKVRFLIDHGADINKPLMTLGYDDGFVRIQETPLDVAKENEKLGEEYTEIVKLLYTNGAKTAKELSPSLRDMYLKEVRSIPQL